MTRLLFKDSHIESYELSTLRNEGMVVALDKEIKCIQKLIVSINPFSKTTKNTLNPNGSILSLTLCVIENQILQLMIRYFESVGIESAVLMLDGDVFNSTNLNGRHLRVIEALALQQLDMNINPAIKPVETNIKLPKDNTPAYLAETAFTMFVF